MSAINNKEGNQGIWWHPENLGPLKSVPYIKQFGSMKFSKVRMDENMRPHLNDGIEIHFVKSGKYKWVVDNTEVELLPDNLSVTTPWQLNGSPEGKMDIGHINWIVIKPEEFSVDTPLNLGKWTKLSKKFQENLGSMMTSENVIVIEKAKVFKKYFIELEKELKNQEKGFKTMVGNIIENFFIDLNRYLSLREQQISEEDNFIERLTQVVNKDLNKKWIIEDLATLFGMGKTKFTYEVKKLTGYPPNSFIINLKIEKAIEMIKASNYSMSDIAFACGFSSVQHFSSTFSQRIGVSPANYQK
ncbi:helix-turn-helix domain-containing protein [Leeuwenhoekiella marinoflava]|uniref:AraC-like DNA-binding protein n=2 Tax=Leeuwenhoekiella marinoflava TaxID=988 RepID=A0A4Q0PNS6_9FLAO|nr:AraC family transcriptional regulator [Leeuwenhoekiella marinoflava]RXG32219.1 AraC-like DNA-binding protein [Leeuwenhoekiella marinoflava]SHE82990.1 AraC-type DNA-binding protein [Leeuwenhoekiella marinoflava DSM 3653]